jgi:hypothetical protein
MDMYVIENCVTRKKPVEIMYFFNDGSAVKVSNNGVFTFSTATLTESEAVSFVLKELGGWRIECPVNSKTVGRYTYYIIGNDVMDVQYRISKQEFGKDVYDSGYGV